MIAPETVELVYAREFNALTAYLDHWIPSYEAASVAAQSIADLFYYACQGMETQFGPYRQLYMIAEPRARVAAAAHGATLPHSMARHIPLPTEDTDIELCRLYSELYRAAQEMALPFEAQFTIARAIRIRLTYVAEPNTLRRRLRRESALARQLRVLAALLLVDRVGQGDLDPPDQMLFEHEVTVSARWREHQERLVGSMRHD